MWGGNSSQFYSEHTQREGNVINSCSCWVETVRKFCHEEYLKKVGQPLQFLYIQQGAYGIISCLDPRRHNNGQIEPRQTLKEQGTERDHLAQKVVGLAHSVAITTTRINQKCNESILTFALELCRSKTEYSTSFLGTLGGVQQGHYRCLKKKKKNLIFGLIQACL